MTTRRPARHPARRRRGPHLGRRVGHPRRPGRPHWSARLATGSAGCLAALTAVATELNEPTVGTLAASCADRPTRRSRAAEGMGFAFGASGIGWALAHAGGASTRCRTAAREAVVSAGIAAPADAAPGWCSGQAGLVLDAIARPGPTCGTPGAVRTPGLLSGLAGIGSGLLRLGFGDRVPSVLLLQPGGPIPVFREWEV